MKFVKERYYYQPSEDIGVHLIEEWVERSLTFLPFIKWRRYVRPAVSVSGYLMYAYDRIDATLICGQLERGELKDGNYSEFRKTLYRVW